MDGTMAEKKKNAKMANRNVGAEVVKDDGDKYVVVRGDVPVYGGLGVSLPEAIRLATSLEAQAGVSRVNADGTRTPGSVASDGQFHALETAAA
jgi:hypothetical protein